MLAAASFSGVIARVGGTNLRLGVKGTAEGEPASALIVGADDWRGWELATWNRRIVRHFFLRGADREGPVGTLLVTPEELARVVGAPAGLAMDVRDALVQRVQRQIRRQKSLLGDATEYDSWPRPPPVEEIPRFVAHLTVTCLAAAESNEDFANEHSFIVRLRELTGDQLPDASLADLPRLWSNLAAWLATDRNRRQYRSLALPDPGGFTRIGYSIKLTFPDRRDQAELSRLLDEQGLGGAEPPVASVLRLISDNRGRFRRSLLEAYQNFLHAREAAPRSPSLREHRFWVAVREAGLRGRGATDVEELGARVQLLAEPQDERLTLFIVADRPIVDHPQFATVEMNGVQYNEWTHLIVLTGVAESGSDQHQEAVRALLAGSLRLPRLSTLVDQGLIALVAGSHGLLEIAHGDALETAEALLVRADLSNDLAKVMNAGASRFRQSAHSGWQQANNLALRRLPSDILVRTSLANCWQLHEVPSSVPVRLVGGVRTEAGWLGYREVLPRISAPGAKGAHIDSDDAGVETLAPAGAGQWTLPPRDLGGAFELVVDTGVGESRRTLQFYTSAAGDRFKRPGDAASRMVEGFDDSARLDDDRWLSESSGGVDAEPLCEDVAYLGGVVGEFLETPEIAAWRIVRFGGALLGSPVHKQLCVAPSAQVAQLGLRRRWWKLLSRATPAVADFEAARRSLGRKFSHLPVVECPQVAPTRSASQPPQPDPRVERLASILAARASTRAGIAWGEWCELVLGVLGIPRQEMPAVTRAWEEVGCIDVASFARWRNLAVFARQPALVAVRSGDQIRATLMGLSQDTTRAEVARAAANHGVLVDTRRSVSQFVSPMLTLRAPDAAAIHEVARRAGLDVRWLTFDLLDREIDPRAIRQPPPIGYDHSGTWSNWSLERDAVTAGVQVTKWTRPDGPTYWRVVTDDLDVWSYHPNHARLWACTAIGESPFDVSVDCELRVRHAYLPLPLARVAAALGAALPGPDAGARGIYRYLFVSNTLRSLALEKLRCGFRARHNARSHSEGDPCSIR